MLPWILLDTAPVPGDATVMRLWQRGTEFSIRLGTAELMNSRLSGSEEALATLALARQAGNPRPGVLIGGLGMGFTLRAAQAVAGEGARLVVAELVPAVAAWARGPLVPVFGTCLDDPRVDLRVADVMDVMRTGKGGYDVILLDVDNGPEAMTRAANDGIYDQAGLAVAFGALRPGGILAIWSSVSHHGFARRLRGVGFDVEETTVRASRSRRGARHVIWLATRPGRGAARAPVRRGSRP